MKKLIFVILAAISLTGCAKEEYQEAYTTEATEITETTEEEILAMCYFDVEDLNEKYIKGAMEIFDKYGIISISEFSERFYSDCYWHEKAGVSCKPYYDYCKKIYLEERGF